MKEGERRRRVKVGNTGEPAGRGGRANPPPLPPLRPIPSPAAPRLLGAFTRTDCPVPSHAALAVAASHRLGDYSAPSERLLRTVTHTHRTHTHTTFATARATKHALAHRPSATSLTHLVMSLTLGHVPHTRGHVPHTLGHVPHTRSRPSYTWSRPSRARSRLTCQVASPARLEWGRRTLPPHLRPCRPRAGDGETKPTKESRAARRRRRRRRRRRLWLGEGLRVRACERGRACDLSMAICRPPTRIAPSSPKMRSGCRRRAGTGMGTGGGADGGEGRGSFGRRGARCGVDGRA